MTIPGFARSLVLVIIFAVAELFSQLAFQPILQNGADHLFEQLLHILDVIDSRVLQQFKELFSSFPALRCNLSCHEKTSVWRFRLTPIRRFTQNSGQPRAL